MHVERIVYARHSARIGTMKAPPTPIISDGNTELIYESSYPGERGDDRPIWIGAPDRDEPIFCKPGDRASGSINCWTGSGPDEWWTAIDDDCARRFHGDYVWAFTRAFMLSTRLSISLRSTSLSMNASGTSSFCGHFPPPPLFVAIPSP